jgi:serine/threonine protein kinase
VEPLAWDDPVEIAGYQLCARLGSGGMGRVYLALTPARRPVALKVVRPDLGDDAEFRRRFRQEVDASRRVHGMYTAQVLDAGPDATPPWLVTAYVPGPSLQQAVAGYGPLPEQTVFVLLAGVAEALTAIHAAGIVHRDLKPSDVLLAPGGPRVIDSVIARAVDSGATTQAVDVFALGAVALFAATGRPAFGDGGDLRGCPPRLREVVWHCLAKDPAARPSPAEIIAACRARAAREGGGILLPWLPPDLRAALPQHFPPPLVQPPLVPPHPVRRAARTRPMVLGGVFGAIGLAAAAMAAVLAVGGGGHGGNSGGPGTPGHVLVRRHIGIRPRGLIR